MTDVSSPKPPRKPAQKFGGARVRPGTQLAGALRKLEDALARDHEAFAQQIHAFRGHFHNYSPRNRIFIFLQRPTATFLKGRKQWERDGRTVKKGARAIHIFAPVLDRGDATQATQFTQVKLYDITDTEGPPFKAPTMPPDALSDAARVRRLLTQLETWVRRSGLDLRFEAPRVNTSINGATDGLTIWIRPDLDPAERLRVIAHEIAHVKLHFRHKQRGEALIIDRPGQPLTRDVRELQAELTAFLLLTIAGIDTSKGSAIYLSSWNATMKDIRKHTPKAFSAACAVLRDCERGQYKTLVGKNPHRTPLLLQRHAEP